MASEQQLPPPLNNNNNPSSQTNNNEPQQQLQRWEQQQHPPPQQPQPQRSSSNCILEGTLLHRNPNSSNYLNKKNIRMYTIFDMSGSAGASLEVGGIGSLRCYRFVDFGSGGKKKSESSDLAYTSTKFTNKILVHPYNLDTTGVSAVGASGQQGRRIINNYEAQLILNIPGHLPWVVMDVENDPTAFVVEISTVGLNLDELENNDNVIQNGFIGGGGGDDDEIRMETVIKEEEEQQEQQQASSSSHDEDDDFENDDGVFVFWGVDDEEEDEDDDEEEDNNKQQQQQLKTTTTTTSLTTPITHHNQVQLDLSRAISKNKPYIRYAFKCPSRQNEKALWLAAFSKVGRLSEDSKRKKTLFGTSTKNLSVATIVPTAVAQKKKNSRIRRTSSPTNNKAADLKKITSLGDGAGNVRSVVGNGGSSGLGGMSSSTTTTIDESTLLVQSQKEYRVRPNYAYQHRWMTHSELTEEMLGQSLVMHDTRLSPSVATTTNNNRRELGLIRVEVLQCRGLPPAKGKGGMNPNCVVYLVCGSYAFATDVIPQKVNPMWLRGMRRACALPVFHGYAVLMVGVFHDDGSKGSSSKDTFFGRVEVPIARLRSNTTYDVTLPLRESTSVYNRDKLGAVRLRFSWDYYDPKQFILSYAPGRRNKIGNRVCTTVACADPKSFRNIALTVHGAHLPDRFSTDMFKAAIRELTFVQAVVLRCGKQYVRDLVYWKYPIFSAYCFGGWMHCVYSNSVIFVPVYLVGFALLHLAASYFYYISSERDDVRPLSWEELFLALQTKESKSIKRALGDERGVSILRALGSNNKYEGKTSPEFPFSSFAGYSRFCVDECLNTSRLNSESEDKGDGGNDDEMDYVDDDLDDVMGEDVYGSIDELEKPPLPEQNISVKEGKKKKDKSIKQELEEVEEKVQKATKYLFQYHTYYSTESNEPPFGKKVSAEKGGEVYDSKPDLDKMLGVGQFSQWNPIVSKVTCQFIPITRILGVVLSMYRSFYSIVTWRDPILTFWLSIAGMISIAVLLVFPWRLVFFLVGVLFLGPQNWVYRIFRENFLDDTKNRRPGRIVRAVREILKDDDGNVWAKNGRADKNVQSKKNAFSQPLFRCHAPVSDPLVERTNNIGAQHVVVPYSAVFFSRFSDWPPDPDHTRVFSGSMSFNASLCPSSANDIVSFPELAVAKKKVKTLSSADAPKKFSHNRELMSTQAESSKLLTTPSKPQHTQKKEAESNADRSQSQPVNVKTLSSAAKTMGNRVAARMTAKLQPTLSKYKQVSKIGGFETSSSKFSDSVQSLSDAKAADEDTFDDGIPSVIETVTTNNTGAKNDHDSQQNSEVESSVKESSDDQHWNDSDQVGGGMESRQSIGEEDKGDSLSKIDENQDADVANALHLTHGSTVEEAGEITKIESAEHTAPLGASSDHDDDDSDEGMNVLRSSPSSDSTTLLHQLMSIKLELATARTENDNYKKKLQETEEERDLYKEKLELIQGRVGFLANTPLLNAKGKPTLSNPNFQLFGKKKNQMDTQQK